MTTFQEVLLVADDPIFQLIGRKMLERHGIADTITIANNGRQALSYLVDQGLLSKPEQWSGLVLLDVSMPVMTGFELLQALQSLKAESFIAAKVVMLSSSGNAGDKQVAQRFGVKAYLEKPLTIEHLLAVL